MKQNRARPTQAHTRWFAALFELYSLTANDFTRVSISKLAKAHRISHGLSTHLQAIGFIEKKGGNKDATYKWKVGFPTLEMANTAMDECTRSVAMAKERAGHKSKEPTLTELADFSSDALKELIESIVDRRILLLTMPATRVNGQSSQLRL